MAPTFAERIDEAEKLLKGLPSELGMPHSDPKARIQASIGQAEQAVEQLKSESARWPLQETYKRGYELLTHARELHKNGNAAQAEHALAAVVQIGNVLKLYGELQTAQAAQGALKIIGSAANKYAHDFDGGSATILNYGHEILARKQSGQDTRTLEEFIVSLEGKSEVQIIGIHQKRMADALSQEAETLKARAPEKDSGAIDAFYGRARRAIEEGKEQEAFVHTGLASLYTTAQETDKKEILTLSETFAKGEITYGVIDGITQVYAQKVQLKDKGAQEVLDGYYALAIEFAKEENRIDACISLDLAQLYVTAQANKAGTKETIEYVERTAPLLAEARQKDITVAHLLAEKEGAMDEPGEASASRVLRLQLEIAKQGMQLEAHAVERTLAQLEANMKKVRDADIDEIAPRLTVIRRIIQEGTALTKNAHSIDESFERGAELLRISAQGAVALGGALECIANRKGAGKEGFLTAAQGMSNAAATIIEEGKIGPGQQALLAQSNETLKGAIDAFNRFEETRLKQNNQKILLRAIQELRTASKEMARENPIYAIIAPRQEEELRRAQKFVQEEELVKAARILDIVGLTINTAGQKDAIRKTRALLVENGSGRERKDEKLAYFDSEAVQTEIKKRVSELEGYARMGKTISWRKAQGELITYVQNAAKAQEMESKKRMITDAVARQERDLAKFGAVQLNEDEEAKKARSERVAAVMPEIEKLRNEMRAFAGMIRNSKPEDGAKIFETYQKKTAGWNLAVTLYNEALSALERTDESERYHRGEGLFASIVRDSAGRLVQLANYARDRPEDAIGALESGKLITLDAIRINVRGARTGRDATTIQLGALRDTVPMILQKRGLEPQAVALEKINALSLQDGKAAREIVRAYSAAMLASLGYTPVSGTNRYEKMSLTQEQQKTYNLAYATLWANVQTFLTAASLTSVFNAEERKGMYRQALAQAKETGQITGSITKNNDPFLQQQLRGRLRRGAATAESSIASLYKRGQEIESTVRAVRVGTEFVAANIANVLSGGTLSPVIAAYYATSGSIDYYSQIQTAGASGLTAEQHALSLAGIGLGIAGAKFSAATELGLIAQGSRTARVIGTGLLGGGLVLGASTIATNMGAYQAGQMGLAEALVTGFSSAQSAMQVSATRVLGTRYAGLMTSEARSARAFRAAAGLVFGASKGEFERQQAMALEQARTQAYRASSKEVRTGYAQLEHLIGRALTDEESVAILGRYNAKGVFDVAEAAALVNGYYTKNRDTGNLFSETMDFNEYIARVPIGRKVEQAAPQKAIMPQEATEPSAQTVVDRLREHAKKARERARGIIFPESMIERRFARIGAVGNLKDAKARIIQEEVGSVLRMVAEAEQLPAQERRKVYARAIAELEVAALRGGEGGLDTAAYRARLEEVKRTYQSIAEGSEKPRAKPPTRISAAIKKAREAGAQAASDSIAATKAEEDAGVKKMHSVGSQYTVYTDAAWEGIKQFVKTFVSEMKPGASASAVEQRIRNVAEQIVAARNDPQKLQSLPRAIQEAARMLPKGNLSKGDLQRAAMAAKNIVADEIKQEPVTKVISLDEVRRQREAQKSARVPIGRIEPKPRSEETRGAVKDEPVAKIIPIEPRDRSTERTRVDFTPPKPREEPTVVIKPEATVAMQPEAPPTLRTQAQSARERFLKRVFGVTTDELRKEGVTHNARATRNGTRYEFEYMENGQKVRKTISEDEIRTGRFDKESFFAWLKGTKPKEAQTQRAAQSTEEMADALMALNLQAQAQRMVRRAVGDERTEWQPVTIGIDKDENVINASNTRPERMIQVDIDPKSGRMRPVGTVPERMQRSIDAYNERVDAGQKKREPTLRVVEKTKEIDLESGETLSGKLVPDEGSDPTIAQRTEEGELRYERTEQIRSRVQPPIGEETAREREMTHVGRMPRQEPNVDSERLQWENAFTSRSVDEEGKERFILTGRDATHTLSRADAEEVIARISEAEQIVRDKKSIDDVSPEKAGTVENLANKPLFKVAAGAVAENARQIGLIDGRLKILSGIKRKNGKQKEEVANLKRRRRDHVRQIDEFRRAMLAMAIEEYESAGEVTITGGKLPRQAPVEKTAVVRVREETARIAQKPKERRTTMPEKNVPVRQSRMHGTQAPRTGTVPEFAPPTKKRVEQPVLPETTAKPAQRTFRQRLREIKERIAATARETRQTIGRLLRRRARTPPVVQNELEGLRALEGTLGTKRGFLTREYTASATREVSTSELNDLSGLMEAYATAKPLLEKKRNNTVWGTLTEEQQMEINRGLKRWDALSNEEKSIGAALYGRFGEKGPTDAQLISFIREEEARFVVFDQLENMGVRFGEGLGPNIIGNQRRARLLAILTTGQLLDALSPTAGAGTKIIGVNHTNQIGSAEQGYATDRGAFSVTLQRKDGKRETVYIKEQNLTPEATGAKASLISNMPAPETITRIGGRPLAFVDPLTGQKVTYGVSKSINDFQGKVSFESKTGTKGRAIKVKTMLASELNDLKTEGNKALRDIVMNNQDTLFEELGYAYAGSISSGAWDRRNANLVIMALEVTGRADVAWLKSNGYKVLEVPSGEGTKTVVLKFGNIDNDSFADFHIKVNGDGTLDDSMLIERVGGEDMLRFFVELTRQTNSEYGSTHSIADIAGRAFGEHNDGPLMRGAARWYRGVGSTPAYRRSMTRHFKDNDGKQYGVGRRLTQAQLDQLARDETPSEPRPSNGMDRYVMTDTEGRSTLVAEKTITAKDGEKIKVGVIPVFDQFLRQNGADDFAGTMGRLHDEVLVSERAENLRLLYMQVRGNETEIAKLSGEEARNVRAFDKHLNDTYGSDTMDQFAKNGVLNQAVLVFRRDAKQVLQSLEKPTVPPPAPT